MGLRPLEIFVLLQCGDRRQIFTTKVYPRAVRVKDGHLDEVTHLSQFKTKFIDYHTFFNNKK